MPHLKSTLLAAALLVALPASAGSIAAISGRPQNLASASCFTEVGSGGIKNTGCAGSANWQLPIVNPRTSTGTVTIKASAGGTCTGAPGSVCLAVGPSCTARRATAAGTLVTFGTKTLSAVQNTQTTVATFTNVAPTDTLSLYCALPGTSTLGGLGVMSVTW